MEHAQSERQLACPLDKGRDEFLRQQEGFQSELEAALREFDELLGFFDALSAGDRPYKLAVPWERALDILHDEAKRGLIDVGLLELFRDAEIFRLVRNWKTN